MHTKIFSNVFTETTLIQITVNAFKFSFMYFKQPCTCTKTLNVLKGVVRSDIIDQPSALLMYTNLTFTKISQSMVDT